MPEEKTTLAESDVPTKAKLRFGYQIKAVERTGFRRLIAQIAKDRGAEIHWEHTLVSLEQGVDEVTLNFENGHTDTASFVIGCDGIHSNTRGSIFGHEKPDFTGFKQVCRTLDIPRSLLYYASEDSW
jgi:salicylate hydroxylase